MKNESQLLKKLNELRDQGVLSEEEYEKKRKLIQEDAEASPGIVNSLTSIEDMQRFFGMWSNVLAAAQALFFILLVVSRIVSGPWLASHAIANGMYALGLLGISLGIIGLIRATPESKSRLLCRNGIIYHTLLIVVTIFTMEICAMAAGA